MTRLCHLLHLPSVPVPVPEKGLPTDYRTGGLLVDSVMISERDSSRTASKTGHGHGHGHGHGKELIGRRTANLDLCVIS